MQAFGNAERPGSSTDLQFGNVLVHLAIGSEIARAHALQVAGGGPLELSCLGVQVAALPDARHGFLRLRRRPAGFFGRRIDGERKGHLDEVQADVVTSRRGELPTFDDVQDMPACGTADGLRILAGLEPVYGGVERRIERTG